MQGRLQVFNCTIRDHFDSKDLERLCQWVPTRVNKTEICVDLRLEASRGGIQDKGAGRHFWVCICRLLSGLRNTGEMLFQGLDCKIEHNRLKHEYSKVKEADSRRVGCLEQAQRENLGSTHQAELLAKYFFILTLSHTAIPSVWADLGGGHGTLQEFRSHRQDLP